VFTPRTLSFLRALARNNDREWFKARKADWDADVHGPLLRLVAKLAEDLPAFAPDLACSPRESLFRQYRDTRFSEDKRPLKTHIAAVFPPRGAGRHGGAGLYVQIEPKEVWIGGGLYHAATPDLTAVRQHLAANFRRFRAIVEAPAFKRRVGEVTGDSLKRVPRGFAADDPAAEYLKLKDLLVMKTHPGEFATSDTFYPTLLGYFRDMAPFVRFLNEPLLSRAARA
jgi:uncharacterized protein (TIGR02453 family)